MKLEFSYDASSHNVSCFAQTQSFDVAHANIFNTMADNIIDHMRFLIFVLYVLYGLQFIERVKMISIQVFVPVQIAFMHPTSLKLWPSRNLHFKE